MGKMFFNILATFAEFEADLSRSAPARAWPSPAPGENCAASSPNCPTDSSGNSAACTPRASIPSARSLKSSQSQDQPSIALSTAALPLSVRSCPLPESTPLWALLSQHSGGITAVVPVLARRRLHRRHLLSALPERDWGLTQAPLPWWKRGWKKCRTANFCKVVAIQAFGTRGQRGTARSPSAATAYGS